LGCRNQWRKKELETMARQKRVAAETTAGSNALPYVQVAAFCELVLKESDGVISAVRIVDTLSVEKPSSPEEEGKKAVRIHALVALKSGAVKGPKTIKMFITTPSGVKAYPVEMPAIFEGDGAGVTLHVIFALQPSGEGLYWCDVLVDEACVTRMPLRIVYRESSFAMSPTGHST
jgi:hypothetical protein